MLELKRKAKNERELCKRRIKTGNYYSWAWESIYALILAKMKRKHKTYSKPKRPFDKVRINIERELKKEFGLKNKKEIWVAESKIKSIREKAKKMTSFSPEGQGVLFKKLKDEGFNVNSIGDVLSLEVKDYLNRRLQTILVDKKLATTPKSARQLIVHKKVLVDGRVVNSPSYIVTIDLENKISLKESKK